MANWDDLNLPAVCEDPDLQRVLNISNRTLKRKRHVINQLIPELPSLDRRHRYSRADVIRFLERQHPPAFLKRRRA